MNYLRVEFELSEDLHELFIAELMDMDFYGFEQFDDKLVAYIEKQRFNDSNREYLEQLVAAYSGDSIMEFEDIPEQNWNQSWEQTIQPQRIGKFLVKPTWSTERPVDDEIVLEVDPKMSFGTGYHTTTRLVLKQIQGMDLKDKVILDAGTGTGILAIAAIKLGARKAIGFDIDSWSRDNAHENSFLNKVNDSFEVRFGGIETIDDHELFDLILANINRNVLIEILPDLVNHLNHDDGMICLSGLLHTDEDAIRDRLYEMPVQVSDVEREEEWILMEIQKVAE
ncbi:MAG: 50S ribosomal protein L11 methyltransferase [Balneolaceae bacterium]|nr:50S ribosomal protein L11 methyltransferase [Balneolaceae bacterium]